MSCMKRVLAMAVVMAIVATPALAGSPIWHDPYLNWDLDNLTGVQVNDLDVIVDNPNGLFNPPAADLWSDVFENVTVTNIPDHDGDGDADCRVTYSTTGAVPPGATAHGGIYMLNSGAVLDAYWTLNGVKVGASIPVTYELTEIRGDPEIHMQLQMNKGYLDDLENPGLVAGWTEIRTFVNLPADLLGLEDINRDLVLSTRASYEVDPMYGNPGSPGTDGTPILQSDQIIRDASHIDSFFDVYLAQILPEFSSPEYESLLVATVIGTNPVDPEGDLIQLG